MTIFGMSNFQMPQLPAGFQLGTPTVGPSGLTLAQRQAAGLARTDAEGAAAREGMRPAGSDPLGYGGGGGSDLQLAYDQYAPYRSNVDMSKQVYPSGAPQGAGFTPGPQGTAGGLIRAPGDYQAHQQTGQFGYGTAPGQGGRGYYEQQTPIGSVAAANQQFAQGAQQTPTMFGQQQNAYNPYIGQTSQGIGGAQSVLPYAQQVAGYAQQTNPYLGQQSQQAAQVGANPYSGDNPYLQSQIDATTRNAGQAFNDTINPAFDRMQQASGSFGNTGVEAARGRAVDQFGQNLASTIGGMRMQDYTAQQQLGENALNRQQQVNLTNAGMSANDLARNMGGFYQGQGLGLQGLNSLVGAAQFDSGQGVDVNKFNAGLSSNDLSRNAGLAQSLGQFNAGQGNAMSQFNAGAGNQANQFWGNLGQQNSQFNAGQGNSLNQYNAGALNNLGSQWRQNTWQGGQNDLNRAQGADQFNQNMDFNTWQANNNNMRNGTLDQINFMNTLLGWQGLGQQAASGVQNTPLNYWQQFVNGGATLGGQGGTATNSQNLQGNPYLGLIGGWLTGGRMFGG